MRAPFLIVPLILLAPVAAWGQSHTVVQQDKKFAPGSMTIKKGESVVFSNQDPIAHNVFSQSPGMSFDLRTQKPGTSSTVKFDRSGTAEVQCAIHPQMKMTVQVD